MHRYRRPSAAGPIRWLRSMVVAAAMVVVVAVSGSAAPVDAAAASGSAVLGVDRDVTAGGTLDTTTLSLPTASGGTRAGVGPGTAGPGWTVESAVPAGTQQVALSWRGDPQAQFAVRTKPSDGQAWSTPAMLEGDVEEAPDAPAGRPGAGPLWVGAAGVSQVQVRLDYGLVSDVRLEAMRFTSDGSRAAIAVASPATPAGGPPIRLRSSWAPGGWVQQPDCPAAPAVNVRFQHAVIHHTETTNSYRQADVPGILAGIYRFHTDGRKWCDIAYNFFVDRFGGVWEGRLGGIDNAAWGGHAKGFNVHSVGVALIGAHEPGGSYPAVAPAAAELTSLRDVLAWKLGSQGIDPRATVGITSTGNPRYAKGVVVNLPTISGHGDTGFTSCPGSLTRSHLATLRAEVASRIAVTNDAARWAPLPTGARYYAQMLHDAAGYVAVPSQIGSLTSQVVRAGAGQEDVAASVILSPKTDARIGAIDRLYRTVFGRSPDTGGLAANVASRDAGRATRDMAQGFLSSAEFKARYGAPNDTAFTALLVRNALGREPVQADYDRWLPRLAGGLARTDMVVQFSESAEHKARMRVPTRLTVAFFALVRRVPAQTSRTFWEPKLRAGTAADRDLVAGLLRSQGYHDRF